MATTPTQVTVEDPHDVDEVGGDGHAHEAPMLLGYDGKMHPSRLQHFFVSSEQQFEASKLGMWLFLSTEILLFGGMFVAYGIFRVMYPELYEQASLQLDTVLGAANTLVLLLSSLTMAWAIRGAQMDNRKVLIGNLIATMVLACVFLVVKYFEYEHKFELGIFPGVNFELNEGTQRVSDLNGATPLEPIFSIPPRPGTETGTAAAVVEAETVVDVEAVEAEGNVAVTGDAPLTGEDQSPDITTPAVPDAAQPDVDPAAALAEGVGEGASTDLPATGAGAAAAEAEHAGGHGREGEIFANRRAGIFFAIYYMMTGIHALHIVIGIIAIGFLVFFAQRGDYSSVWYTPVENVGLYWHIVDIIWIFVFPLMYLI